MPEQEQPELPEQSAQAEQIEQAEKRQAIQNILDNVLPVLQAHDWPGKDSSLTRSLCYLPKLEGTPWVSFGFDMGTTRAYVSQASLNLWGVGAEELETIAINNMCRVEASWQVEEIPLEDQTTAKALICISEGLVAERIIDPMMMLVAQEYLGENLMVAFTPSRDVLIVAPFSEQTPNSFIQELVQGEEGVTLSNWLFCIQDGLVTGRIVIENGQFILDKAFMP
jgi:uncharacterized protein YtpQ (UPF0354 family)